MGDSDDRGDRDVSVLSHLPSSFLVVYVSQ